MSELSAARVPLPSGEATPLIVSNTCALNMAQVKGRNLALTGLYIPSSLDSGGCLVFVERDTAS